MFSTGFRSGARAGSRMMVRFFGTLSLAGAVPSGAVHQDDAMGLGGDVAADLVEMPRVLAKGSMRAAPLPHLGQMAPNR